LAKAVGRFADPGVELTGDWFTHIASVVVDCRHVVRV
jgi:hypothetical protein